MLTESPELLAVTQRWMKAQEQKNPEVLVGLFSDSEHLRYIGTGHGENWKGRFVRDGYSRHTNEIPAFTAHVDHIEAFENGSTGWANWIGTLKFEHMEEVKPIRMTWIFVLERGNWKIAQMHLSTPRTNFEIAGHEHYAFAELIEAAKQISPSLGQQGTATIMFTDVVGSTALNAQFGDKVWASKIHEHFSTIRAIVAQDDGEVVKSLGDGTMSSFPTVAGALRSSIALQRKLAAASEDAALNIRIGIHAGDVIKTDDDFFGNVVNTAARVAEAATARQILVSESVRGLATAGEFSFGETISLNIRGIKGESTICPLHW